MAGTAATGKAASSVEDVRLARAAAAGDGSAFATLYERYERRTYNLAYRTTGSEPDAADATQEAFLRVMRRLPKLPDGEQAFGSSLLTATRNACHDLMEKRRAAPPSGAMPETQQEEIRDANLRLPERQRETLALRELEGLPYEEVAAILDMNRSSVAQLIARARINLSDELHGTALAAVTAPSRECERALPLIAAREDGQLEAGSDDDAWLDAHLDGCERCRLGVEAMQEAGASYRAWAPVAALPWLLEETMAKVATLAGVDWSGEIAGAISSRADPRSSGTPPADPSGRGGEGWPSRRRAAIAAAGLAALSLGGGVAFVLAGSGPSPSPDQPAAGTRPGASAAASKPKSKRQSSKRQKEKRRPDKARPGKAPQASTAVFSPPLQAQTEAGGSVPSEPPAPPAERQGAAGLQPPRAIATPKPKPRPAPPPQPAPAPPPPAETRPGEPPTEDEPEDHPSKGRGPPAGVPPRGGPR